MPNLSRKIPNDSDMARKILQEIRIRVRMSERTLSDKQKEWREAEESALAYLPERDVDAARRAARENGLPEYTTIQIPYSYAVLLSAHTYLTSVFMARSPVLQYTGRHGESQQQIQAMEAVVDYQVSVGAMLPVLYTWLYDSGKYGVGIIGQYWEERTDLVTTIKKQPRMDILGQPVPGAFDTVQESVPVTSYKGNKLYNCQPWDFLWDTRHPIRDFQKGEYCATRFALSWNECKRREAQGYYINLDKIGPGASAEAYGHDKGSSQLHRPDSTNSQDFWPDESGTGIERKHPMLVRGYECHVEIIPKEWGLSDGGYPEKWVFTCTGDFKVLMGVQPLGMLHAKYPFHVLPLECEAYGLVTRGYMETLKPVQNTIDWLINSHFYNVRAVLNDKMVVDPSKVIMKDVLDPLPGGIIRMKPGAYGSDPAQAIKQLQVTDVTQNNMRDLQMMFGMGERTVGVNDQVMGMLNTGGRKTATEIRTSTSFSINRLKTTAEWFSMVGFTPMGQMTSQNTQQFMDAPQKFKIAGDLLMTRGMESFIMVDPQTIAGAYDFVPVDGTLPIDRMAQANMWKEMMLQARNNPMLMMGYDWAGIFEWVAQLAGLKNISRFKIELGSPEQLAAQASMGNSVAMNGRGPSGSANARPALPAPGGPTGLSNGGAM